MKRKQPDWLEQQWQWFYEDCVAGKFTDKNAILSARLVFLSGAATACKSVSRAMGEEATRISQLIEKEAK